MHQKSINELLDLYLNHQLNQEQQQELFNRINKEQDHEQVTAWFQRIWDEIPLTKSDKSSEITFSKLKRKLGLKDVVSHSSLSVSESFSSRNAHTWLTTLSRYAAVFLLAFGLAWLVLHPEKSSYLPRASKVNVFSVPNGSKAYLTLEDGTQIWLNCGSKITYKDFSDAPDREVFLEGEAFFDVTRDNKRPFVVNTSYLKLKVLGTRFNVKSYPSEKIAETILVSGKLQIEEVRSSFTTGKIITLEPNQKATFYGETGKLKLDRRTKDIQENRRMPVKQQVIETVNPELYTSWKDEKLIFTNERLESLVVKMERWYNVNITLKDTLLKNYRYTGKFEKESIEQALKALKLATPLEYQIDKNNITLYLSEKNK
ncbi:MAG: FecR family protein [Bacteroidales bacterium]|nr:FecR family protein [Bacteroidales bacterium]